MVEHPTYPNPVILEALCEFHFRVEDAVAWPGAIPADLYKRLEECGFTSFEPVHSTQVELKAERAQLNQVVSSQELIRFRNPNQNWLVQLGNGLLTVNILPVYPGWDETRDRVLAACTRAFEVLKPASLERIGLRYINGIACSEAERAGDWLKASPYIPEEVLGSQPGFFSRLECRPGNGSRLVVMLAERQGERGGREIIFDIDCADEAGAGTSTVELTEKLVRLHEREWQVFAASMTPRLEARMRGDNP